MSNSRGPSTELCGTPDSIVEKSADEPLSTTRCFLLFEYVCSNFNNVPGTSFCSSLKTKQLCQTLSKALEISKNIALSTDW